MISLTPVLGVSRAPKRRAGKIRSVPLLGLPVDPHPRDCCPVRRARAVVVTAAPGAGKTTRVPPALAVDGPVIVLQPRRVAARSLAKRIAARARLDDRPRSRLARSVRAALRRAHEGPLRDRRHPDRPPAAGSAPRATSDDRPRRVPRAQQSTRISASRWRVRPGRARTDLRLVVMSATLDASAVAALSRRLPDRRRARRPAPARRPLHAGRARSPPPWTPRFARRDRAGALLPAGRRRNRARGARDRAPGGRSAPAPELVELHGSLDARAQDERASSRRRRGE